MPGLTESELSIEAREHTLTVKGEKSEEKATDNQFLYRGIAKRAFERRFQLADHVEIQSASLKNGLLHIDLLREIPEAASRAASISLPRSRRQSRSKPRRSPAPPTKPLI